MPSLSNSARKHVSAQGIRVLGKSSLTGVAVLKPIVKLTSVKISDGDLQVKNIKAGKKASQKTGKLRADKALRTLRNP